MKLKGKKKLPFLLLFCLLFGLQSMSVAAAPDNLHLTQKIAKVSKEVEAQEYEVSYTADKETGYSGGARIELRMEKGFQAASLAVGDWSDYEGGLTVSVYSASQDTPVFRDNVKEAATVDLKDYKDIRKIQIQTDSAVTAENNIAGLKVSGDIHAKDTDGSLTVEADYLGSNNGTDFQVQESKKVTTNCHYYELNKPVLSLNSTSLEQLDSLQATISGIGGKGTEAVKSFTLNMEIPDRMITDRITVPTFENGTVKLYIDDSLRKINPDDTYNVGSKVKKIQIAVTVKDTIKQTKDMVVSMRNTQAAAGTESLKVTVDADLMTGSKVTASSDVMEFTCVETIITPPVDPEGPPVDPDLPPVGPTDPEEGGGSEKPSRPGGSNNGRPNRPGAPEEDEEEDKVVDLSGLNLQSARAEGTKPVLASIEKSDKFRTSHLQSTNAERVQETKVFDFSDDKEKEEEAKTTNLIADNEEEGETLEFPADKIEKTPAEKAKEKVKEASENRFLPIFLVLGAVLLVGAGITVILLKDKKDKEASGEAAASEVKEAKTSESVAEETPVENSSPPEASSEKEET